MKTRGLAYLLVVMVCGGAGWAWAGWEYTNITLYGWGAGNSYTPGNEGYNTFIGFNAGYRNTTGWYNTYVGDFAGNEATGGYNTFVGASAGLSSRTGSQNTFLGCGAGINNHAGNGNVFIGYNAGWYQVDVSNKLFIGNSNTSHPLIYGEFDNNLVVINGILSIASSREYKENIDELRTEEAMETLQNLKPVKFSYKVSPGERHVGFISEEVPESLTSRDRKAVSPMDIVAVLTKVVQEQQKTIEEQRKGFEQQKETISIMANELREIRRKLRLRDPLLKVDSSK